MDHAEGPGLWYIQPKFLFYAICFINLMNYVDRGIIPGATNEFNTFIDKDLNTDTPDVYLGLLQSSFIIGFMIGCIVFSHLIHHHGRFLLVAIGCTVWLVAVALCGLSYFTGSYTFLLFCRILSGVGEASIQTSIPPWIQQAAPADQKGAWLALFYTAIPVGTALGYAYSSIVAAAVGWDWAFFLEALFMVPFVLFLYHIAPHFPCDEKKQEGVHKPTPMDELRVVSRSTLFVCISCAYAAQAATLQGLSTFGSAFLMGLGFFDSEAAASSVFGVVVSVTGMISTPLGGMILDRWLAAADGPASAAATIRSSFDAAEGQLEAMASAGNEVELRGASHAGTTGAATHYRRQLQQIGKLTTIFSFAATLVLCMTYFTHTVVPFLLLTALGTGFLFATYSAINMGVMLSVPTENRSFGIAMNTFLLHAIGDVPAPILVGYIKDSLAPGCIADSGADDDEVASSDACRDDAAGLRTTILLTELWMWWTVFFFALAWYLNSKQILTFPWAKPAAGSTAEMRSPLLSDEKQWPKEVVSDLHASRES